MSIFDDNRAAWEAAMKAKGHTPIYDDDLDGILHVFVTDHGFHNGPGCSSCGWTCCMHCRSPEDIPQCAARDKEGE